MHSRETGAAAARLSCSMHPLWSESVYFISYLVEVTLTCNYNRYAFPVEPGTGIIDLTAEERPFYYNSHSGELSLDFPNADNACRGGVLA